MVRARVFRIDFSPRFDTYDYIIRGCREEPLDGDTSGGRDKPGHGEEGRCVVPEAVGCARFPRHRG